MIRQNLPASLFMFRVQDSCMFWWSFDVLFNGMEILCFFDPFLSHCCVEFTTEQFPAADLWIGEGKMASPDSSIHPASLVAILPHPLILSFSFLSRSYAHASNLLSSLCANKHPGCIMGDMLTQNDIRHRLLRAFLEFQDLGAQ